MSLDSGDVITPYQPVDANTPPKNHLTWAILVTVMGFWPLGIAALVQSSKVNTLWYQGNVAGAMDASRKTRKYAMWGTIIAGIIVVLYLIFIIVMVAVGVNEANTLP